MTEVKPSAMIKEIPNFSRYLANLRTGKIYKKATGDKPGRYLNLNPNAVGYIYGSFINDSGERVAMSVHTIILGAAVETDPSKPFWLKMNLEIDHLNSCKSDCRFENLHLTTKKLNHQKVDRSTPKSKKLEDEVVISVREAFKEWVESGKPKIEFYKIKSKELGMNSWQTAQYLCLNRSYKKVKSKIEV